MRATHLTILFILCAAIPSGAADFLGAELCRGSVDTSVVLPVDSPLSLESAEIGRHGDLLLLLTSDGDLILDQIDDLMTGFTGVRGTGDEKKLQWSGNGITAYAQIIKKGYAALAVSSDVECQTEDQLAAVEDGIEDSSPATDALEPAAAAAAVGSTESEESTQTRSETTNLPDFELEGQLKHTAAEGSWVDVMGVVVNRSGSDFKVANFDLSSYDANGRLICVDAISVSQLRSGQERAFRDSIRCADYVEENVASWKLQFSGGH